MPSPLLMRTPLHLFQAFGVELEYMIVDAQTLRVRPIADQLMFAKVGEYLGEVELGRVAWSNELVNHVVEIKCNGPSPTLEEMDPLFREHVQEINRLLSGFGARLLPTAAHPFMLPERETVLWPHDNREIYQTYDRIFDCRGHGWANLQSTHLNLPFQGDLEFERLHAAVRLVLPLLPALCAGSPVIEGKATGKLDTRLEYYRHNQERVPAVAGHIIPERAFSEAAYEEMIFSPIQEGIAPHDPAGVLDKYFLNSRGAIARFDRGAIEIRLMDVQECPRADLALLDAVVYVLKELVGERWASLKEQKTWDERTLKQILLDTIVRGERTVIQNRDYLGLFQLTSPLEAGALWKHLLKNYTGPFAETLAIVLEKGSLSTRILKRLGSGFSREDLLPTYRDLADSLGQNKMFLP